MNHQDINKEEMLEKSKVLFNKKRLLSQNQLSFNISAISNSLQRMQDRMKFYVENFELTNDYRTFRNAFLSHKFSNKLADIVEFRVCDNIDQEKSYFINAQNKVIVCSNKVTDQQEFNTILKYNLVFLYDKLRAEIDWTDCKQIACMQIRGLNISGQCQASDQQCFQEKLKHSFNRLELCKGKDLDCFDKVYKQCSKDLSPINSFHTSKSGFFF